MGVTTVNASYIISMAFSHSRTGHAELAYSTLISGIRWLIFSEKASLVWPVVVTWSESAVIHADMRRKHNKMEK